MKGIFQQNNEARRPAEALTRSARAAVSSALLCALSIGLWSPQSSQAQQTASNFEGLKNRYRSEWVEASRIFQDRVDPFTGNLSAKVNLISLPGNGGFDIRVGFAYKTYGMGNYGSTDISTTPSAALGGGRFGPWRLDHAPVVTYIATDIISGVDNVCDATSTRSALKVTLAVDGNEERLYHVGVQNLQSPGNWQLSCDAPTKTQILKQPDGTVYRLGSRSAVYYPSTVSSSDWRYVYTYQPTRASDPNGNYLDITYAAYNAGTAGSVQLPTRIAASDGRTVDFVYDTSSRLAQLQTSGATWSFEYAPANRVSKVVLPDNSYFAFEYADVSTTVNNGSYQYSVTDNRLSKVTWPGGGSVVYEYSGYSASYGSTTEGFSPWCSYYECHYGDPPIGWGGGWDTYVQSLTWAFRAADVKKRSTSDGGVWTYTYNRPIYTSNSTNGQYDVVTVDGPSGRIVHRFYGLGYFTPSDLGSYSRFQNVCNHDASGYSVYGKYCNKEIPGAWMIGLPVDVTIGSIQTERFTWIPRQLPTIYDALWVSGRVWLSDGKKVLVPDLQSRVITRDGVDYTTSYSGFDPYGNPSTKAETGPLGGVRTTTLTYLTDTSKWIIGVPKDASFSGGSTTRSFDANGNLLAITQDGVTTSYTYDGQGNVATKTLPRGLVHAYPSYKRGIALTENQPEGVSITRQVSDAGNVTSETNGEGKTTAFGYDGLGRLTGMAYPRGNGVGIGYTTTSKTVTRGSLIEKTVYDGFGRSASVTLGGIARSYGRDALGRTTFASDPGSGSGNSYQYDILDRLVKLTHADGTFVTITYGAASKSVKDERGAITTYNYRAYGDPTKPLLMWITASDPSANVTMGRNAKDLVTSLGQGGFARVYGYDSRGYLVSVDNPETGITRYGRDDAGNMTTRSVGSSGTTNYSYDAQNRLRSVSYPGGTPPVTQTYSKTHRLKSVATSVASRTFAYDSNDNLASESLGIDGLGFTASYSYNANDQLISITYPRSGRVVSYAPDVLGRPTQVSGAVSGIGYWPSGQVSQINYANGTSTFYGQNIRLWPAKFSTSKGVTGYLNSSYGYDGAGNLTSISDSLDGSYNRTLAYDALNRVVGASGPWGSGSLSYDGSGNLRSQSFGSSGLSYGYSGTSNLLTSVSGMRTASYNYDAYGDIVAAGANTYGYDGVPNMTCANCGSTTARVQYQYDGLNQRVSTQKGGVKTYEFYSANGNLLSEFTPSLSNRLVETLYLGARRVAQMEPAATTITPPGGSGGITATSGTAFTLTAVIVGSSPTGTVTFYDGTTLLGSASVIGGKATLSTTIKAPGTHTVKIDYSGDVANAASSTTVKLTVLIAPELLIPILQLLLGD